MRWTILALAFLTWAAPLPARTLRGVKAIAASGSSSFALLSDGTVWGWGAGGLGDGTLTNRAAPVPVSELTNVVAIGQGLAVKADGTVWEWGGNLDPLKATGNLMVINKVPVLVKGISGAVAVAGGGTQSLALTSDGTVWAWGVLGPGGVFGSGGLLGDEGFIGPSPPVLVSPLTEVVAIAQGVVHGLAARSDGSVWAWGDNRAGAMGDGFTAPFPFTPSPGSSTPTQVRELTAIVAVAAGYGHSLALSGDGTVWAWGFNGHGQLGDGTTETRMTPVQVSGLTGVLKITAGDAHSIAVKRDGSVWAWGSNAVGQLGDGTTTDQRTPIQVSSLSGIAAAAGGGLHSLALKDDGTVWAWGRNDVGQLGDGVLLPASGLGPFAVGGVTGVAKIAAGDFHSLVLKDDGTVWAWGANDSGQLGDGTQVPWAFGGRSKPMPVSELTGVIAIGGSDRLSLAVTADGAVWEWGSNVIGAVDGKTTPALRLRPVRLNGLSGVVWVASGPFNGLAVKGDGTLWEWGGFEYGEPYMEPEPVAGLSEVVATAAVFSQRLALKRDGTVWQWQWGGRGLVPEQVGALTGVVAVAAGCSGYWCASFHSLALKGDGTVWAWGANDSGQLGDGMTTGRTTPVQVSGLSDVVAVAARAGDAHSVALKSDGTVWEWPAAGRLTPTQVDGLSEVVAIAEGGGHSLALKRDGSLWAWGSNGHGQLGVETIVVRTTPAQVVGPATE